MFKQIILPLLAVIAFIAIIGIFVQKSGSLKLGIQAPPQATITPNKTIIVGTKSIRVQIANTPDERTKGLSGITSLGDNDGMLFVFTPKDAAIFWMKEMLFPLDIIWINNGKIIRIDKNIPKPPAGTQDSQLKTYSAGQLVDGVLEVNGGFSDKNKVKVGDTADLSLLK
jgi:uncharacterized membrane protein (UPF0127 family)